MLPYLIITAVRRLWIIACAQEVLFSNKLFELLAVFVFV
jgi:hypothetical protein